MMKKGVKYILSFCIIFSCILVNTSNVHAYSNIIGTYTTQFGSWDKPRTKNILLSSKAIDYYTVPSGSIFSFNEVVGERTEVRGYEESTVFVYDQKVKGIGGGVCQVSTTLYNSASYAGLEIIERHTHKREIFYAPVGRDATVDYPTLDFKFKNNYPFDVQIRAYTTNDKLTVEILKI